MINCPKFYWLLICWTPHPDPHRCTMLRKTATYRCIHIPGHTIWTSTCNCSALCRNIPPVPYSYSSILSHCTKNTNKMTCAPSEDSDQPRHPPSLIIVFAVRFIGSQGPSPSSGEQRRLWSDWEDAQADLSPRWRTGHFVGFVVFWLNLCVRTAKAVDDMFLTTWLRFVWAQYPFHEAPTHKSQLNPLGYKLVTRAWRMI